MRKSVLVAVAIAILLGAGGPLRAQPQAEGYTLDDIYYFLAEGIEATWGAHSLEPQSGAPGEDIEGFTKSLEDIYYFIADAFGQCDVTINDLAGKGLTGKKYFSTDPENWGVVVVPAPTPAPTPRPWYDIYGPGGTGDVVLIGSMYVASRIEDAGCAYNGKMSWPSALTWASGLDWLGKGDWRLPTKNELSAICSHKGSLGSFMSGEDDYYWSSTELDAYISWVIQFNNCYASHGGKSTDRYVRAVRDGE